MWGGRRGSTGILDGHGVRGVSNMRGTIQVGWPCAPLGLKKRRPSK
jgi:hypothetical protein